MDFIYRALKFLDAEKAHDLAKWAMKKKLFAPGVFGQPQTYTQFFHYLLMNPLGLAAGFDKNGELVDVIHDYGFGFIEVGSVTYRGGKGNPKPRMFRLNDEIHPHDIMNRMGLNGDPAREVAKRLSTCKVKHFGVNIAKTHDPQIIGDLAIEDMRDSYQLLKTLGMYTTINVSCPNTKEGKTFEQPEALKELLSALEPHRAGARPMFVKLSPTLFKSLLYSENTDLIKVIDICEDFGVHGYVCCNTVPFEHPQFGRGGRSGALVCAAGPRMVTAIRQRLHELNGKYVPKPIIGVGGIFTGRELNLYYTAGADLYQAYNGFVNGPFAGVRFAHRVLEQAIKHRESDCLTATLPIMKGI